MDLDRREMLGLIAAMSVAHLPSMASASPRSAYHVVALPTGLAADDLLLLAVGSTEPISTPIAGWNMLSSDRQGDCHLVIWQRLVDDDLAGSVVLRADKEASYAHALYHFGESRGGPEFISANTS